MGWPCYTLRARCPSILRSIAIKLNVPRDEFSLIAIELIFVTLGHGFKKAGSVLLDIRESWEKDCIIYLLLCIAFTIGESPRVCSKYGH